MECLGFSALSLLDRPEEVLAIKHSSQQKSLQTPSPSVLVSRHICY